MPAGLPCARAEAAGAGDPDPPIGREAEGLDRPGLDGRGEGRRRGRDPGRANAFPGARISEIRPRGGTSAEPAEHAPLAPAPDDLGDDVDYDTLLPDFTDGEDAP
jgi:hypothetical protein